MSFRSKIRWLLPVLFVLLAALYLLRWPLLGPWIEDRIEATLGQALGCGLEITSPGGTLVTSFACEEIRLVEGEESGLFQELYLSKVKVDYHPLRLLRGDLSALTVRTESAVISLDLDQVKADSEPHERETDPGSWLPLPRLPGIAIESFDLRIRKGDRSWHCEKAALHLGQPDERSIQQGQLEIQTLRQSEAKIDQVWRSLTAPLFYSAAQVRLGPFQSENRTPFLTLNADLEDGPTPQCRLDLSADLQAASLALEARLEMGVPLEIDLQARLRAQGEDRILAFPGAPDIEPPGSLSWQDLAVDLKLQGPWRRPAGRLAVTAETIAWDGCPFQHVDLAMKGDGEGLQLEHLHASGPGNSRCAGKGSWKPGGTAFSFPSGRLDSSLRIQGLELHQLSQWIPAFEGMAGLVDADIDLALEEGVPAGNLVFQGKDCDLSAAISSSRPDTGLVAASLLDWNLQMALDHEGCRIENLVLQSDAGKVEAEGEIEFHLALDRNGLKSDWNDLSMVRAWVRWSDLDLAALPLDEDLAGSLSGELRMAGPWSYPDGEFAVNGNDLVLNDDLALNVAIQGTLKSGILLVDQARLSDRYDAAVVAGMRLDLNQDAEQGTSRLRLPCPETPFHDLTVSAAGIELQRLLPLSEPIVEGLLGIEVKGEGTLGDPLITAACELDQGVFYRIEADPDEPGGTASFHNLPFAATASLSSTGQGMEIVSLRIESDRGLFHGQGRLPLHLAWLKEGESLLPGDEVVQGMLKGSEIDLAVLSSIPGIRRTEGTLNIETELSGTLNRLAYHGSLAIEQAICRVDAAFPTMEIVNADMNFDGSRLTVNECRAMIGGGDLAVHGSWPLVAGELIDLHLQGDQVLLYREGGVKVRSDLELDLSGTMDRALVTGEIVAVDSRIVKHIPVISGGGPPPVSNHFQPFSISRDTLGDRLAFDVKLTTRPGEGIRLDNNLARGRLDLDLRLKGPGHEPYFLGNARFHDTRILLPNFVFTVDSGQVEFLADDPFMPRLICVAEGRRQSIDVQLVVQGPLNDLEMILSSSPPLDSETLAILVATGSLPQTVEERGMGNEAMMQVGTYLARELIHNLFGSEATEADEGFLDRFALSIGTEVSTDGTDNIVLEYQMDGPWYMQLERDIYTDMNLGLVYRIRFQ